jgi:hypothetical protein
VIAMWHRIHRRTRCYQHMIRGYQFAVGAEEAHCLNRSDVLAQSHSTQVTMTARLSVPQRKGGCTQLSVKIQIESHLTNQICRVVRGRFSMRPKQCAGKLEVTSSKSAASAQDRGPSEPDMRANSKQPGPMGQVVRVCF